MIDVIKENPGMRRSPWMVVLPNGCTLNGYKTKKAAVAIAAIFLKGEIATFQRQKPTIMTRMEQMEVGKRAA